MKACRQATWPCSTPPTRRSLSPRPAKRTRCLFWVPLFHTTTPCIWGTIQCILAEALDRGERRIAELRRKLAEAGIAEIPWLDACPSRTPASPIWTPDDTSSSLARLLGLMFQCCAGDFMFSTGGLPPGSSSAIACPGFEFVRPRVLGPDDSRTRHDCYEMAQRASARRNHELAGHTIDAGCGRRASGRRRWGSASAVMNLGTKILLARRYLLRRWEH